MMGIVLGLLGPAIALGKCIVAPIKRQFNYLCCFNSNIQELSEEAKKLEEERIGIQMEVDTAIHNALVVDAKVESWLKQVNEIQEKMNQLEMEITKIKGGGRRFSVKSRYSASKIIVKTVEAMKQKCRDRRDIILISHRPPPASVVSDVLERSICEFESRTKIEGKMMAILKDENVQIMGVCGMGGVGKTTVAEKIKNRVLKENVFGESLMVVVSQTVDKLKIQGEIAEKLGLKLEETSLSGRAQRLCNRLMGGKRILLVLDDVWKYLDLKELGIPCKSGPQGCTILLTSRDRGVLARMNAQQIYVIETLTPSEAWSLFKEKLGTCVDNQNQLFNLAQEIVNECKGLPLALVSVAGVLKDEKKISVWRDALVQLRSSNPEDLSDVLKDVYTPIKLSYDYLTSQNARSVFLLCCVFPVDFNIPLENLFAYATGLSMFEGIRDLEQARDKIVSLVEMLKSRFLLLEGQDERYIRMHDVVRDVAIFIASKENRLIKCGHNSTWISPFIGERIELSKESTFPNLRLLKIGKNRKMGISFEGMTGLSVLSASYYYSSISLPTQFLKGLRTLILENCECLKSVCDIGKLINLDILICRGCDDIEELSSEIMSLKRLRLLEISNCRGLKKIRAGVISSLDKLEELKIVGSFDKWEAENKERRNKNVCLNELENLSKLTRLEIEVSDSKLTAQEISLPRKIERYQIIIGDFRTSYNHCPPRELPKKLYLYLAEEITLGKWMHECVTSVEGFVLRGDGSNSLDFRKAQNIRWLKFESCSTVSSVVRCGATVVFPLLESIQLEYLKNLEEICAIDVPNSELSPSSSLSSSHNSLENLKELRLMDLPALKRLWKTSSSIASPFSNLTSIIVYRCEKLVNLVPLLMAGDCLPQLELLIIGYCDKMEQVFLWKEEENEKNNITITFPKLKRLELTNLSSLKVFYQGIESIEFPLLNRIEINCCPELKVLVPNTRGICIGHDKEKGVIENEKINNTLCPQIPIGSFTHLEDLIIKDECGSIKSLLTFSMAQNLKSLKRLEIENCSEMVKVIDMAEEEGSHESTLVFPHLEKLSLFDLPKLKMFCKSAIGLPKLVRLEIRRCSELGSLATSNLESLERVTIKYCSMMEQAFVCREQETGHMITFPKLTLLELVGLTRLTTLYNSVETIEFPLLSNMEITKCPNLKSLVSATTRSSSGDINNEVAGKKQTTYFSLSIWDQIPIARLEELSIHDYDNISNLFPSSVASNLINLKFLRIGNCYNMVKVIEDQVEEHYSNETTLVFPHLRRMQLINLPKLKIFCDWKCVLKLPLLEAIYGRNCPKLERLSLGSLSMPNLKNLTLEYGDDIDVTGADLNHVLHQRFITLKEEAATSSKQN